MRIISLAEWQPLQLAHKKWGGVVQIFIFSTMALPCCFVFLFFFCCFKLSSSSSPNYHHHHLHHDDDGMVYTMKQFHEGIKLGSLGRWSCKNYIGVGLTGPETFKTWWAKNEKKTLKYCQSKIKMYNYYVIKHESFSNIVLKDTESGFDMFFLLKEK